jgi:hypothetical protein
MQNEITNADTNQDYELNSFWLFSWGEPTLILGICTYRNFVLRWNKEGKRLYLGRQEMLHRP